MHGASVAGAPLMIPVFQHFAAIKVADVEVAMRTALEGLRLGAKIRPGMRVAITVGSRGISNIPLILRTAARYLKELGAKRLSSALAEIGSVFLETLPILGGVAVLENGREETADLLPVEPGDMIAREQELLVRSKELLPRLPVKELDLLMVEEMGKNISGTGMDTNIIGRIGIFGVPDGEPEIQRIAVMDLSEASHGNANGMGLADFITRRYQQKIDLKATYLNTLTATFVHRARMPITLESDQEMIQTALKTLGNPAPDKVKAIRIRNTLMLEHIWVSAAVWEEIKDLPYVEPLGPAQPLLIHEDGALIKE